MIARPVAGRAVIAAAGGERGGMEGAHFRMAPGGEGEMDARFLRRALGDPEGAGRVAADRHHRVVAVADGDAEIAPDAMAERRQRRRVEGLAPFQLLTL